MPETTSERLSDFELQQIEKEAKRLIVCMPCGGSGQIHRRKSRTDEGRWEICERCSGEGRAIAEPHVLLLIDEVRQWRLRATKSPDAPSADAR